MNNSNVLKNELIFQYAAGNANMAKSLMASTYLFLNSKESSILSDFEDYCGEELKNYNEIKPINLTASDCIKVKKSTESISKIKDPLSIFINNYKSIKWKKIFNGFYDYSFPISNKEKAKLIKMKPGVKVPLHSHNGKEYILVLDGSFTDEYGEYHKGSLQINDSNIKHTPVACKDKGCICLTITEEDLVFYGPLAPLLNIMTFLKSYFSK
jgi:putative transcriptional regulator